jgi:hypothetical protein
MAEQITTPVWDTIDNPAGRQQLPAPMFSGKLRVQMHYWDDDLDSGDTIHIAKLPKGAVIVAFFIVHEAFGAAVVASIGDSGDPDRYVAAGGVTTMNAAGTQVVQPRQGDYTISSAGVITPGAVGVGYRMPAITDIIMVLGTTNMDGSDHRMDIATVYAVE